MSGVKGCVLCGMDGERKGGRMEPALMFYKKESQVLLVGLTLTMRRE